MKKDIQKWITLILVAVISYWIINNFSTIGSVLSKLFNIIFPFILGGSLAFILNIPMTFFEDKLLKLNKKKRRKGKIIRVLSIIFAIAIILLILSLIIKLIVPELVKVVNLLIENIPYYIQEVTKIVKEYDLEIINSMIENIDIQAIKNQIVTAIPNVLTSSISIVGSIVSGIANFIISIIFAIYILIDKEKLQCQLTKMLTAYLGEEKTYKIINVGSVVKSTFKNFFTVQCLEATILGTLCMIGMLILKIPYAVPIGVLIGVTALIPVVGAFLGVIVGSILIVAVNPFKVLTFVIFVLILQQIEGNVIYPRVVGNSVGLPGMWVLFAVTVGGSIGGILGMLIGVPIATIIYTLLRKNVKNKLESQA